MAKRDSREPEQVRAGIGADTEWTRELSAEPPQGVVDRTGAATVIKAEGIAKFAPCPKE